MSNYHLRDKNLSSKARGLLSQMLSLPDDWDFTVEGLVAMNCEGWGTIRSILKELEETGYLMREREQDEKGHFKYSYLVLEKPLANSPYTDLPHTVEPHTDNHRQLNTNILNTELLNTDNDNRTSSKRFKKPTMEELIDYFTAEGSTKEEAERFFNYYESNGWKVGKNKMQKWKASAKGWMSRSFGNQPQKKMPDFINPYKSVIEKKPTQISDDYKKLLEELDAED